MDGKCALAWWARYSVVDLEQAVALAPENAEFLADLKKARGR